VGGPAGAFEQRITVLNNSLYNGAYITRMNLWVANMIRNVRFETKNASKKSMDIAAINTAGSSALNRGELRL
jgi:hypothetical protein